VFVVISRLTLRVVCKEIKLVCLQSTRHGWNACLRLQADRGRRDRTSSGIIPHHL
jgi:hypothetical protein